MNKNLLYRSIPKVDTLLADKRIQSLIHDYGREIVMDLIREELEDLRESINTSEHEDIVRKRIEDIIDNIELRLRKLHTPNVRKVINGSGTILHTNLGRAPISRIQAEKLVDIVTGYSNLEYDLDAGKRGERYSHFEKLLCRITGAEAAMVVNNNASAVMLILNTMAKDGEVIVSRGELVEIGGKFRIPDVMEQSNAKLVEVGTTNKTHISDYESAITENTKALLKVHTSNYRIVGFTESVSSEELKPVAEAHDLPVIEDLGSGSLIDLSKYGISHEPTVQDTVRAGVDVVCFSGDKLLGGPQAGIIIGRKKYIDAMKKNQLTRALRVDKFTVTALELVLMEYLSEEKAMKNIPVLRMINESQDSVRKRAAELSRLITETCPEISCETVDCESQIGGGSLPLERIKSAAVSLEAGNHSADFIEKRMRMAPVPIIPRTSEEHILLDVRTIPSEEFPLVAETLKDIYQ
ncbi:seryl-tRNA(Sec) selenium transferase [Lachnospiraceae bacterium JC7]|nr:seryl-tRNA(Sec) selenium transferase [Lachnospiraceae bacterium JC7]